MGIEPLRRSRAQLVTALVATILVVAGMVVAKMGQLFDKGKQRSPDFDDATNLEQLLAVVGTTVVLLAGVMAIRSVARGVGLAMTRPGEEPRAAPLSVVVSAAGYVLLLILVLSALDVPLEKVLLGGALTGVALGIAAQQTLGNFFAGIVLLAVRPFNIGDQVVLRSGPLGGEYEGHVVSMSLFYVGLLTDQGPVQLPNSGVLAAAVGPGARAVNKDEVEIED